MADERSYEKLIQRLACFSMLDAFEIQELSAFAIEVTVEPGNIIVKENELIDAGINAKKLSQWKNRLIE